MAKIQIKGLLLNSAKLPLTNLRVEIWDKELRLKKLLAAAQPDGNGRFAVEATTDELKRLYGKEQMTGFFKIFEKEKCIFSTENSFTVDLSQSQENLEIIVDWQPNQLKMDTIAMSAVANGSWVIKGKISTTKGKLLEGIIVEAHLKSIVHDVILGKTLTQKDGAYTLHYSHSANVPLPDVQLKIYRKGNEKHPAYSEIKYNVAKIDTLDAIVAEELFTAQSEFEILLHDIKPHLHRLSWKEIKETTEHQHITYLSHKTGWDARLVSMLVVSHQLAEQTRTEAAPLYALFREGVPGTIEGVCSIQLTAIETSLKRAIEKNIISRKIKIEDTLQKLHTFIQNYHTHTPQNGSLSSLNEMLNLRLTDKQKIAFNQLFHTTEPEKLWDTLHQKGFPVELTNQLRLDGKLGFLTGNNVPLIQSLYKNFKIQEDQDLVTSGLYKAANWKRLIGKDLPPTLNADEYAEHLAKHVRKSFPTAIAGIKLKNKEIKFGDKVPTEEVSQFFISNQRNYQLGEIPLKNWRGFERLSTEAKVAAKSYERLYQISPSDEAMHVLAELGIHSAFQLMNYSKDEFITTHAEKFPTIEQATLAYNKANEVYSTSLGITTSYLTQQAMPNVYAISGTNFKIKPETAVFPTLEELFGNMDYCACEHCKSVLSPAAYLVELLQFIDHSKKGIPAASNPIELLFNRRPDIQHLQLTCENTNTVLPYIDLVNEILEHYILNGDLENLQGHNATEFTKSADLLAEPQFVEKTAYDLLKNKVYPFNLPFDQPLETLRQLFQIWDLKLENALDLFVSPKKARIERLHLNESEYKALTDINASELPTYFGLPKTNTIAQINAAIADGKTFSRTVGLKYEDLVKLLKTNFINPGNQYLNLFLNLNINFEDLYKHQKGLLSDNQLKALIPTTVDKKLYSNDILKWVKEHERILLDLILLTDLGTEAVACDFAQVELRYAFPDQATNQLKPLAYHKFHRFIRLQQKTGWPIEQVDQALTLFTTVPLESITEANLDAQFTLVLDRISNFKKVAETLELSAKKVAQLFTLFDPAISEPVRKELCAKFLKISLKELEALTEVITIYPLDNDFDLDEPSLLRTIQITRDLKAQGIKIADLVYVLQNKDLTGKLTANKEIALKNSKILRDLLTQVEKENSISIENPDFQYAKNKMLQVYDAATTEQFFGFVLKNQSITVPFITIEEQLPKKITDITDQLEFDPFAKELKFNGVLSAILKTQLLAVNTALVLADLEISTVQSELDTFKTNFSNALDVLVTKSNTDWLEFSAQYPELKTLYDAVTLEPTPEKQAHKLVDLITPELKARLKKASLRQTLADLVKTEVETIDLLTSGKEVLQSDAVNTEGVVYDILNLEQKITFTEGKTYSFYLDIPTSDAYLLYAKAPANTKLTLTIDGQAIFTSQVVGASGEIKNATEVSFKTGVLKYAELKVENLAAGKEVKLLWRTKSIAKTEIPSEAITDSKLVGHVIASLDHLQKVVKLQTIFHLTNEELHYFAQNNSATKNILNELDFNGNFTTTQLQNLWQKVESILAFNTLKNANEPEENTWISILNNPSALTVSGKKVLEYVQNWQETDFNDLLVALTINRSDLEQPLKLKFANDAMQLIATIGYPVATSKDWITANPTYDQVAAIKQTIRANVSEQAWLETMQTVSNNVRNSLRDALVNYVLHYKQPHASIDTADKLYEHFLIDVEMDACMKTSRILQAISTVQLFIQRALINLEPAVDGSLINTNHWAWMKRYRVWEANRKVFLYPENWLEPELRDNKSSLFKELEGDLLQSEITDESAELAFLNYLKKLDDIAKLEIVGMYLEENELKNQTDDILHVFGRTMGNTRQYYYRRFEYGYWTAWEKVSLNVEGEHLFPIVWKKRLFLCWFNTVVKPVQVNSTKSAQSMSTEQLSMNARKNVEITLCWGEYYKGKWTSPKSTDLKRPMVFENLENFEPASLLVYGRKEKVENPTGKFRDRLVFYVRYADWKGVYTLTSKNAAPFIEYVNDNQLHDNIGRFYYDLYSKPYETQAEKTSLYNTRLLVPGKKWAVNIPQPKGAIKPEVTVTVLLKKEALLGNFSLLPLRHEVQNQFEAPLFYADEHSTLFVQPQEEVFIPISRYAGYYDISKYPITANVPVLVEKPAQKWPPMEQFMPGMDIEISNPWEQEINLLDVPSTYTKVISSQQKFNFRGVEIDAGGVQHGTLENSVKTL